MTALVAVELPDVRLIAKEHITLDDIPAIRYRYDVRGNDVQVIAEQGSEYLTVWVGDDCQMVRPGDLKAHVRKLAR